MLRFMTFNAIKSSGQIRGKTRMVVLQQRRATIYKILLKRHQGHVPCFVCGKHVRVQDATLEHIKRRRDGGTDEMDNLSISHAKCNHNRDAIEAARSNM